MPDLATELRRASIGLRGADDLAPLLDAIGDARYVLLGEASHGTHEFYSWRCALTKRLVKEKACSFIAVEGDGPDCYRVIFNNDRDGGISGMDQAIDHRAIGVVYNPGAERWGNYVPTVVPRRYDAFIFTDSSRALDALHFPADKSQQPPETWPSGM